MTREKMITNIKTRLKDEYDIDVDKSTIGKIIRIEEDEVYAIIAENDKFKYYWGTISGESRPPRKVAGSYCELKSVKKNHGWSFWKVAGVPKVSWSREAKIYNVEPPEKYFEQPEQRYTTQAREFRKEIGLPEIPEYESLPEEKILELCAKADEIKFNSLTSAQRRLIKRKEKYDDPKNEAVRIQWEKTGYIPMWSTNPNYTGPQRDTVDHWIMTRITEDMFPEDKLEVVLDAKDMAIARETLDVHPELEEMISKYREEIKEQGRTEKVHVVKYTPEYYDSKFTGYVANSDNFSKKWDIQSTHSEKEKEIKRRVELFMEELEKENSDEL